MSGVSCTWDNRCGHGCWSGCGVSCGAGHSAERGCGLVAVVHAWAVSCAGERGTSTSCERVAERERELEAQVLGARCGARNARAVVGGVRVLWWVLVRVVVAVRMVVAIRERGCCALFCGFFSTIQSKTENRLSFFNQKAYSDIRLIDYSVGFCNAQFSHVNASSFCNATLKGGFCTADHQAVAMQFSHVGALNCCTAPLTSKRNASKQKLPYGLSRSIDMNSKESVIYDEHTHAIRSAQHKRTCLSPG